MMLFNFVLCFITTLCLLRFEVTSSPLTNSNFIKQKRKNSVVLLPNDSGNEAYRKAEVLFQEETFDKASEAYWMALIKGPEGHQFTVEDAYNGFFRCYAVQGILDEGHLYIGDQHLLRQEREQAIQSYESALKINPNNTITYMKIAENLRSGDELEKKNKVKYLYQALQLEPENSKINYALGHFYFETNNLVASMKFLELAYKLNSTLIEAAANAIYLRFSVCNWGSKGSQYNKDLKKLNDIIKKEMITSYLDINSMNQISIIHPHMALGYFINLELKLAMTKSHARGEKILVLKNGLIPYNDTSESSRKAYYRKSLEKNYRIKIGYVSANIKAKTTVYMAQDLMRFHDRSKFEIHVYATSPPDTSAFTEFSMRGVDWREKIRKSVEFFHDTSNLNFIETSKLIRSDGIHILLNWDGYSNNGVRRTGLFPMQSAPIQIAHQEYIGTMGADYVQYLITDPIASPLKYEKYYTEKFIYMPHSFLANSFAYQQPEMSSSTLLLPNNDNPSYNKCGLKAVNKLQKKKSIKNSNNNKNENIHRNENKNENIDLESFVYCNFNKHLKFDPNLFKEWLKVLESVENSYLCLLENPKDSKEYLTSFIDEYNVDLLDRIGYLPFINNPYDNQRRNSKYCNVILDTTIYNGHTTAADALWGGVPIITRGDSIDMGGRVGSSILTTLGVPQLITYSQKEYTKLAIKIGKNKQFYTDIRTKIFNANSATQPKNPFWDLERYVRNLENGFERVWNLYLNGENPRHVFVTDQEKNSMKIGNKNSTNKSNFFTETRSNVGRNRNKRKRTQDTEASSKKRKKTSKRTDDEKLSKFKKILPTKKEKKNDSKRKSKNANSPIMKKNDKNTVNKLRNDRRRKIKISRKKGKLFNVTNNDNDNDKNVNDLSDKIRNPERILTSEEL